MNVIANCHASPETLGVPWKAVQSDALTSITLNVTALFSLSQICFKARDHDSQGEKKKTEREREGQKKTFRKINNELFLRALHINQPSD